MSAILPLIGLCLPFLLLLGITVATIAPPSVQIVSILFKQKDELRFKLGRDAWTRLEASLLKAHETDQPERTAQSVIQGWIESQGPAFSKTDRTIERLFQLASSHGFHELPSRSHYKEVCQRSRIKWGNLLRTYGNGIHTNPKT